MNLYQPNQDLIKSLTKEYTKTNKAKLDNNISEEELKLIINNIVSIFSSRTDIIFDIKEIDIIPTSKIITYRPVVKIINIPTDYQLIQDIFPFIILSDVNQEIKIKVGLEYIPEFLKFDLFNLINLYIKNPIYYQEYTTDKLSVKYNRNKFEEYLNKIVKKYNNSVYKYLYTGI